MKTIMTMRTNATRAADVANSLDYEDLLMLTEWCHALENNLLNLAKKYLGN